MKRFLSLTLCLAMVAAASMAFAATSGTAGGDNVQRQVAVDGPGVLLTSNTSSALAARETAGPDTFALYGGPDTAIEGKFQLANGVTPDWGDGTGDPYNGNPNQWRPVDLTDQPVYWHQDTFNAGNLNGNGAGNNAMWSGVVAGDPIGETWSNLPGYGNSWNDAILYESTPVADNTASETVTLDFYFNHDTEPGYDYFNVQYDSAGTWTSVLAVDGSNKDTLDVFQAPGIQFSTVQTAPIFFAGNDYGGDASDQIRIRLIVTSDGAWSDEDGLWPTDAGAAQVDDITMTNSLGTFSENFEGAGPYLFAPDKSPFAGDFAEVYPRITDIDPCRDNTTPVIGMIDTGQIIRNGPGVGGDVSTGGSNSPGINYGVVGNYVVNYTGGLSFGEVSVTNEIWSPEILWDLPGAADDDVAISGAFVRFDVWRDLPLGNGMFYLWHVRSALAGEPFDTWTDRNFVYYGSAPALWFAGIQQDVSDILQAGPERVQMALAAWDYASVFAFPGTSATPSPVFDNASFYKYRLGGPTFATRTIDTANDGFPVNGSIDVSSPATRGALDIPFDMARDVNSGDLVNTPGDSVIIDVASVIPGATVTDIRMVWALQTNAVFEDALRVAPARAKDQNVVAGAAGTIWTGEVVADTATTSAGNIVENRFFVDLPDVDLMYPGDILHYYIQATDSDGRVTTFPGNTNGFGDFSPNSAYNRAFRVRCLPTITDTAGSQPSILVWNDFGRRGGENEWFTAFQQLGYAEGVDYDSYTTQGPSSGVSNGLGSAGAHGANAGQLAGYNHMFYLAGNLSTFLMSNGSNAGRNDKGNDIDVMEQWHALPGSRNVAYFGDFIATAMVNDSAEGLAYLGATMGVAYGDSDVRDVIGGQTAPLVVPNAGGPYAGNFATNYIAYGGCISINQFDQIQPATGAAAGHLFTDINGNPIPENPDPALGGVASVINPTANGLDMTFPYASLFVYTPQARAVNLSSRTLLFQEILGLFAAPAGGSPVVAAPKAGKLLLEAAPNPFNPMTTVKFTAPIGSRGSVKVFNLRGELVKTLHSGEFQTQSFTWNGTDNRGASVASGVYVIQAQADGKVLTKKAALVK